MTTLNTQPILSTSTDSILRILLNSSRRGESRAFEELYRLTKIGVKKTVLRITRDTAETEELVQETYAKVWQSSYLFDSSRGPVSNWINGIARNLAIDSLRRRQRQPTLDIDEVMIEGVIGTQYDCAELQPLELAIAHQRAQAVQESLKILSVAQRECLMLGFFADLSHSEIASSVGIPLGTVKSLVSRSYLRLKPVLAGYQ